MPAGKPIPAQLLGNMWSQQWNNIYDDLLKPYPAASIETADRQLKAQKWDAVRMTRSAESFYTSHRLPAAARNVLAALDARASARSRSGVPRERVGHGPERRTTCASRCA